MNRKSLKDRLNDFIQARGQVDFNYLKQLLESGHFGRKYKLNNLERRLRPSESPCVEPIEKNGVLVGYRWLCQPVVMQKYKVLNPDGSTYKVLEYPKEIK